MTLAALSHLGYVSTVNIIYILTIALTLIKEAHTLVLLGEVKKS